MNSDQLYAALHHVREKLTSVLARRRRRPRRQHAKQEQRQQDEYEGGVDV